VDGGYGGARSQEAEPPSDPGYPPVTLSEIIGVTRNSLMQSEHVAHGQGCAVQLEAAVSQLAALEDRIKAIDPRLRVLLEAEAAAASSIMVNKKERARAMKAIAADIDALTKAERVDFDKLRGSLRDKAGLEKTVASLTKEKAELPTLLEEDIRNALAFLEAQGYVRVSDSGDGHEGGNNNKYALTVKGVFACGISQCNEVFLTEPMFGGGAPMKTDPATFAAWLAVFIDDSEEALEIPAYTDLGKSTVEAGEVLYDELQKSGVYTGPFVLSLRYVDPVWEWCNGAHLQTICQAYNLFEGNVVRSLLRLVSLMDEVRAAAEAVQKIEWTMLIDEAKALVVRDVLRTESLYLT
jgi:superfamily II RNA helicase